MQIKDLPHTLDDMSYSLSLTGITRLKETRFKKRHGGAKEITQVPGKGFDLSKNHKIIKEVKVKKKKVQKENADPNIKKETKCKRLAVYSINKVEVSHRIKGYVNQMKGEKMLYFWTISFPKGTKDDTAFILLNKWLTRLRYERMLKEYIWVTERQENGTIHFHIVVNRRIDVKKSNKFMRACIMYSISTGEIDWTRDSAKKYNGVDIAKDRRTKRVINFAKQNKQKALTSYLTKYITKNNSTFTHLAWHSSREYSNLITSVRITNKEYSVSKCGELIQKDKPIETEWYIFYRWKQGAPPDLRQYLAEMNQIIQSLINDKQ